MTRCNSGLRVSELTALALILSALANQGWDPLKHFNEEEVR